MIILTKNGGTKIISEDDKTFLEILYAHGWISEEMKKKEVKNAKSRAPDDKSDSSGSSN